MANEGERLDCESSVTHFRLTVDIRQVDGASTEHHGTAYRKEVMTTLEHLRLSCFLSRRDLGRALRLPQQSIVCMENRQYPLNRIEPESRSLLEQGLQQTLQTDLSLAELLAEV